MRGQKTFILVVAKKVALAAAESLRSSRLQCSHLDARHDTAARRFGEFVEREKRVERPCGGGQT